MHNMYKLNNALAQTPFSQYFYFMEHGEMTLGTSGARKGSLGPAWIEHGAGSLQLVPRAILAPQGEGIPGMTAQTENKKIEVPKPTGTPSPLPRVSRQLQMVLAFPTALLRRKTFNKTESTDLSFRGPEVPTLPRALIPVCFNIRIGAIPNCFPWKWACSLENRQHDER